MDKPRLSHHPHLDLYTQRCARGKQSRSCQQKALLEPSTGPCLPEGGKVGGGGGGKATATSSGIMMLTKLQNPI